MYYKGILTASLLLAGIVVWKNVDKTPLRTREDDELERQMGRQCNIGRADRRRR